LMQPDPVPTLSFDRITLNSYSPFGFWTGLLTKQGGFVKNWKVRYFSLTWNHLSYYEENKLFIASIPLTSCIRVEPVTEEKPWMFNLVTRERTFVFESETKTERQHWIEALGSFIAIHKLMCSTEDKSIKNLDEIRKIAFHIFRIINGLRVLIDTHKNLRECSERVSLSLFALLCTFVALIADKSELDKRNRAAEMVARCMTMKQSVLLLKQEIPSEYRIDAEEAGFDIGAEQRRINCHLRTLTENSEPDYYPQFYQFEVIEDDIKPFILETFKSALCDDK